jgi:hypothetical protein
VLMQSTTWWGHQFPRTRGGHVILFVGGSSDLLIVEYVYNILATPFCLHAGNVVTRCRSPILFASKYRDLIGWKMSISHSE